MNRTGFITASASLVAAATAPAVAQAVPGGTNLVERQVNFDRAAFDALLGRPADIRQVFEAVAFQPGMLSNIKNALNGLQFGYGYPADRIAVAIAGHGPSASYGYSDALWAKYRIGEFFGIKDASGAPVTSNLWLKAKNPYNPAADPDDDAGMFQDVSIEMLQKRGVVVLTCHTAVEEQSRNLVKKGFAPAGMTPKDVASDILTHLISGAVVVPSMVATVAVLQAKYSYTYAALTF
jgi:intracellular sulfur oxidation DsrE/DsrF family protein